MNKLAPYFQIPGAGEDILDNWPGLDSALFMDIGPDFAAHLRQEYPMLKLCLRVYEEAGRGWTYVSPEDWAARFYPVRPDYAISWTLPLGQDDHGLFAAFDDWSVRFAAACRKEGIEPVGLCVGTGNFTAAADRVKVSEAFPGICQTYDILGPHDYGWPDLQSQVYWHALRWTAWHDDIKEKFGREMTFMPMECGITQMVLEDRPDLGWQSGADGVTDESYVATMRWYNEQLCQLPYAKRAFVYLFHGYGDWETFDHVKRPGVWHKIRDFDSGGLPPENPEPPEEPPMTDEIKVIDMAFRPRTLAWARAKYGVAFRRAQVAAGQKVYRLVELREKTGHSSLITKAVDASGKPLANKDVAFYWPGAPDPPDPPTQVYPHDWHRNFVHGATNADGDVGPGMGHGAYHGEGEGGPHAVWIRDPDIPSDICEKLGMLAGTFHDHLDQVFALVVAGGGTPEPEPSGDYKLVHVERLVRDVDPGKTRPALCVCYPIMYPDGSPLAFDTRGEAKLEVEGAPEVNAAHPDSYDYKGREWARVVLETVYEGPPDPRTYSLYVYNMKTGVQLTETAKESFTENDPRRIYHFFDFEEQPPEPEPPSGDEAAIRLAMADAHKLAAQAHMTLAVCQEKLAEIG